MTVTGALRETQLPGLLARGKVRDMYDLGDRLMIVATDRISAFDVVMNDAIPGKGKVLTSISAWWLGHLPACAPHHLDYVVDARHVPPAFSLHADQLVDRAMVVHRARVLPVECVVRGYLVGGGWKEYQATGRVSGIELPGGLRLAQALPEPVFTPSTKAATGHDEPIDFQQACALASDFANDLGAASTVGRSWMEEARDRSLEIYEQARRLAALRGIMIADTKFEFGVSDGRLILVDEVLTPDSSRFWPAASYEVGRNPPSFDKQYLRDYLEAISWNKQPPPPPLPAEVIEQTRRRYEDARRMLTT